ncbi:hypothetical protein [Paraliomyxa miuraensis]|uniref:hypothetical protein n=1 Tax=Paraliomyxa miuraensis TaxID=376150 RepID=UPI00225609CD|nr:hypothetical protein [Paraliomyxa miuraensis]MCX4246010.1 hypothetical protein [Paraliomyxa miuraensis]
MLVLSIDADFFVEPIATDMLMDSVDRLAEAEYDVDSEGDVAAFFEERCALDARKPVPGVFIRHHDQAFDVIKALAQQHGPVRLMHVDAHADLGSGDTGYVYLLSDWLQRPHPRPDPENEHNRMNLGNWLAFAAAGGFIEAIEFVPRHFPPPESDLFQYYIGPTPETSSALTFRPLTREEILYKIPVGHARAWEFFETKPVLQATPWHVVARDSFAIATPPDFVIVCQSPQFTPASADLVLDLLRRYVCQIDLGIPLTPPLV